VWSISTITTYALVVIGLTAILVYVLGKRSVFFETELTLGIIAAALFAFLTIGLYHGVRIRRRDLPSATMPEVPTPDFELPDLGGFDLGIDGDEGCLAVLVGLVLAVIVGILLVFALWILLYLGIVLWVFLLMAVAWVFYLALRQVFAKSRVCKGNLRASVGYALLYTLLYTGWLFALVFIAQGLLGPRLREGRAQAQARSAVSNFVAPA
jgi:hypothetical protein